MLMSGHLYLNQFLTGTNLFLVAAGVGFAAAVPLGPISILTIQRTVAYGFLRAFLPAMGAVLGDGIFGILAAVSADFISAAIIRDGIWLRLAGSLLLVSMGAVLLSSRSGGRTAERDDFPSVRLAALNCTLVLTNPLTLAFFLAAFAALGLGGGSLFSRETFLIGAGVSFGTTIWFLLICALANLLHRRVQERLLYGSRLGVGTVFVLAGLSTAALLLVAI